MELGVAVEQAGIQDEASQCWEAGNSREQWQQPGPPSWTTHKDNKAGPAWVTAGCRDMHDQA